VQQAGRLRQAGMGFDLRGKTDSREMGLKHDVFAHCGAGVAGGGAVAQHILEPDGRGRSCGSGGIFCFVDSEYFRRERCDWQRGFQGADDVDGDFLFV